MIHRGRSLIKDESITFDIPMDLEETLEFYLEEGLVRARLSDIEIARLARELKLDLSEVRSWEILEQMTVWLGCGDGT
jgi:hypothetical protein